MKSRNEQVIDTLVDLYNQQDARGFASLFAERCVHGNLHSAAPQRSPAEIEALYLTVFAKFPENRTQVVHRIVVGDFVIDHEKLSRTPSATPLDVVAIYKLENGLITSCEFARES